MKTLRKSILVLLALAVFFWTVVLPTHFHHNTIASNDCSCKHLSQNNDSFDTAILSKVLLNDSDAGSRCPLCVLSSMFSLALIIEDNSSIITFLNEGELSTEILSYYFKRIDSLRARAPPKFFIS